MWPQVVADFQIGDRPRFPAPAWKPAPASEPTGDRVFPGRHIRTLAKWKPAPTSKPSDYTSI